jgi:hypothetical protein
MEKPICICENCDCVKKYSSDKPDLIVSDISFSPNNPDENSRVTITATIKNIGGRSASNFYVGLYELMNIEKTHKVTTHKITDTETVHVDSTSSTSVKIDKETKSINNMETKTSKSISYLGPGQSLIKSFGSFSFDSGTHNLMVKADIHNQVDESIETNNERTESIIVYSGSNHEFSINVETDKTYYKPGETAIITASVSGKSNLDIEDARVTAKVMNPYGFWDSVYLERKICARSGCVYPVGSSESATETISCIPSVKCTYQGKYYIDEDLKQPITGQIDEITEEDIEETESAEILVSKRSYKVKAQAVLNGLSKTDYIYFYTLVENGHKYVYMNEKFELFEGQSAYVVDNDYMKISESDIECLECYSGGCVEDCQVTFEISYQGKEKEIFLDESYSEEVFNIIITALDIDYNSVMLLIEPLEFQADIDILIEYEYNVGEKIDIKVINQGKNSIYYQAMCAIPYRVEKYTGHDWKKVYVENPCLAKCMGFSIEEIDPGEITQIGTWNQLEFSSTCEEENMGTQVDPGKYRIIFYYYSEKNAQQIKEYIENFEINGKSVEDCNGCLSDTTCLPYGIRIVKSEKPMFCDIDMRLKQQKDNDDQCQNNYECLSNYCSNGKCIDLEGELRKTKNLLEKILDWLDKLF